MNTAKIICCKLTLFIVLSTSICSARTYTLTPNGPVLRQTSQSAYQEYASILLKELVQLGADNILSSENGVAIPLSGIIEEFKSKIRYQNHDRMLIDQGSNRQIDFCEDAANARWLTINDQHPFTGRFAMVYYMQDLSTNNPLKDVLLLFHESISALGYIDDAYQITAPLFWLSEQLKKGTNKNLDTLRNSPVLATLKQIKKRTRAPRFIIDQEGSCHQIVEGGRVIRVAGGVIGGGGGGNFASILLKFELLSQAETWWQNNRQHTRLNLQQFLGALMRVGLEPYKPLDSSDRQSPDYNLNMQIGNYFWRQGHFVALKIRYSPLLSGPAFMLPDSTLHGFADANPRFTSMIKSIKEIIFRRLDKLPQGPMYRPILIRWTSEVLTEQTRE